SDCAVCPERSAIDSRLECPRTPTGPTSRRMEVAAASRRVVRQTLAWVTRMGPPSRGATRRQAMSDDSGTRRAGDGVTDEEMVQQVADQTSSDLKHADVFEREADGTTTETEAAKAT